MSTEPVTANTANADNVTVSLGERSYDIHIGDGLIDTAGALVSPLLARPLVAVVTDQNVYAAHAKRLQASLDANDIKSEFIILPAGEATKSFAHLEFVAGKLLEAGIERNDMVIAFGGGVIGDLTGFACSMLRRGCGFIQLPTTLLAQVDSAVGGKTAINTQQGKNLVGAFYQPAMVISDIAALDTLPPRELRAGYAEVVKYGLIDNPEFFAWLEENGSSLLNEDRNDLRRRAVRVSCEAKAAIVSKDEREHGARALLNLGHTFGHALEGFYGYSDKLLHGEAVAVGMALAYDFSARSGLCAAGDAERVRAHLTTADLPASLNDLPSSSDLDADALMALMMQDKKVERGALTLILTRGIGRAFVEKNASTDDVKSFWTEKIAD